MATPSIQSAIDQPLANGVWGYDLASLAIGQRANAIDAEAAQRLALFAPAVQQKFAFSLGERLGLDIALAAYPDSIHILDIESPKDGMLAGEGRGGNRGWSIAAHVFAPCGSGLLAASEQPSEPSHTQYPHAQASDHKAENIARSIRENTDGAASGKRRRIATTMERLAAAYIALGLVPEPLRSTGSAKEITRGVEADHNILHALGGDTRPQNLNLLPRAVHREKSRRDAGVAAKAKRIEAKQATFWRRIAAKQAGERLPAPQLTRKGHRPLPCGRASPWKKPINGNAIPRTA
jgi:hypothetical protein